MPSGKVGGDVSSEETKRENARHSGIMTASGSGMIDSTRDRRLTTDPVMTKAKRYGL